MVIQRKVKGIGGNGLKKNVRNECEDGEDDLLPLAGQEEVLALAFLQSQFLAKAAKQSNQILFQNKKAGLDQATARKVMASTLQEFTPNLEQSDNED